MNDPMFRTTSVISAFVLLVALAACDGGDPGGGGGEIDCEENPTHPDCDPDPDPDPDPEVDLAGSLYYGHSAHTFSRYDFATGTTTSLFEDTGTGSFSFTVSHDGTKFAWADQYDSDQGTHVHVHDTQDPESYREVFLSSANLRYTSRSLALAPGAEMIGALVPAEDASLRDLLLFEEDGTFFRAYPYVKDFAFAPNGNDLVLSMEVRQGDEILGHVVAVVTNYRDETPDAFVVKEFADYSLLPTSLSVSPNSSSVAYEFQNHIYTLALQEGADHHQITTSGSREWSVHWSPDGEHFVLTYRGTGTSDIMGRAVVVPVHANDDPIRIRVNVNGDVLPDDAYAPFPDGLETSEGRVIAKDPGAFWIP